ncbi:hypothetical protein [Sphingomonas oligophenolica]|uniref:Uncharacterized protein n=1 Tax=Sphingomonas oligophenolica TaxID=301154 RepID=A0A502BXB6_9SPHN|nr:hypothetical protein [Sphingomonas oligophenolica]TPG04146.1 hypothetical protein EAH84_15535 [Sphingomonas oligophenolica]
MADAGGAWCSVADALAAAVRRIGGCAPAVPPGIALAVVPLHDAPAARRCAAEAHVAGLAVCHVGYDASRVLIGPIVVPGGASCQQCARLWAPGLGAHHRAPPLPAPVIDIIAAQVAGYIAAWRANEDADQSAKLCWIDVETLARSTHDGISSGEPDWRCFGTEIREGKMMEKMIDDDAAILERWLGKSEQRG